MKETIEGRELFALNQFDVVLRGTYHRPRADKTGAETEHSGREQVGMLFLPGLSAIRSAKGDSAVYWADAFADHGYPSFRLDLPGFGDSEGDPPAEVLNFINDGGFAPAAALAMDQLALRFNLSGFVVVGHCSGSISAIFAAAANTKCRGLVLLDPYFYLAQPVKGSKYRRMAHNLALQSRIEKVLIRGYDFSKQVLLSLHGNGLPENANHRLLHCWKEVSSAGLPILIIKRSDRDGCGAKPRPGEFDYLPHVLKLAGREARVVVKVTEGANHSFANHVGRTAVRHETEQWLDAYFPLAESGEPTASGSRVEFAHSGMAAETISAN